MSPAITKTELQQAITQLTSGRVMVVGDVVIDEMIYGHTHRMSREAPVLILKHDDTKILLGGAGNAAHNIAKLTANGTGCCHMLGTAGKDYHSGLLLDALDRDGVLNDGLVLDESRPTSTKTRISGIANHSVTQQIVRIDRESNADLSAQVETQLKDNISQRAKNVDAILLSDYGLGVMSTSMIRHCMTLAKEKGIVLTVDSQQDLTQFSQADMITPNQPEAEKNLGYSLNTEATLIKGGQTLLKQTGAKNILITRGRDGMSLFEQNGRISHIPVFNRSEVFDVTGAGDTVVGTITLALAAGVSPLAGAVLGNLAASIVVRTFGAATTTPDELSDTLGQLDDTILSQITTQEVPV